MHYIEPANEFDGPDPGVFLAGGISDCEDGQPRVASMLTDTGLVVLNPRRRQFAAGDPAAAEAQIRWEFRHLRRASARLFWFPPQTLCPIAMYELGAWSMAAGPLFVGVDPAYARRADVEIQTRLARPDVRAVDSLGELADEGIRWSAAGAGRTGTEGERL